MKQIILCLIGLILTQQGCVLAPAQFHLSKKQAGSHKQKELQDHKLAKQQHKSAKEHPSLKERITLVDFKFFDQAQHKAKKHHKKKLAVPATGKVSTAFYSLGIGLVDIPRQGTTLMPFLVENELAYAMATTQAIIRQQAIEDNKNNVKAIADQIEKQNKKITSIEDLRPKVIVLQRGPVATVFPRAMLNYPQVANIPVVPDDVISTLDIEEQDLIERDQLLSNHSELDKKTLKYIGKHYTLTGLTKQSGRMLSTEKNEQGKREAEIANVTKKYSEELNENLPAVTVLHRTYRGRRFRIIMPNQHYGALRLPDKAKADASEEEKKAKSTERDKWIEHYKDFENIAIQEGDVIEFTTLDALGLTLPLNALLLTR